MSSISGSSAWPFSVSEYSTRGGHLGEGVTLDHALLLERAQPQRQRARRDAGERALELTESSATSGQVADHEDRPLPTDDVGGRADRAGLVDRRSLQVATQPSLAQCFTN